MQDKLEYIYMCVRICIWNKIKLQIMFLSLDHSLSHVTFWISISSCKKKELLDIGIIYFYNLKIYIFIYYMYHMWFLFLFLQSNSIDRPIRHNGVQHDNRWYADFRYNLHNRALRILAIVLFSLQGISRREIISLSFLSFDLDGVISDNPWRL